MDATPVIHRWPGGIDWIAHPDEFLERSSHAIESDAGLWLVDPVDTPWLDELVAEGGVAGVVTTLDRHRRDGAAVATRHDVSVHLPTHLSHLEPSIDASTDSIDPFVRATGYHVRVSVDLPGWREVALVGGDGETLIVGDALGTARYFSPPGERVSVHPGLRLIPPRAAFEDLAPTRILVGHGPPVLAEGARALADALRLARSRAPIAWVNSIRQLPGPRVLLSRFP